LRFPQSDYVDLISGLLKLMKLIARMLI